MGNIDSRGSYAQAVVQLQTDKEFYHPNEQVTGKIYLRVMMPLDAQYVEIEVKGKEKGSWMDTEYRTI